jgi:hypothetical protein
MASLFGKGRRTEETVLVVDVESASVAAALVVLAPHELPKLFAEVRVLLPLTKTLTAGALAQEVELAVGQAVAAVSLTAARLRNATGTDAKLKQKLMRMGEVSGAILFLSPPWAAPEQSRRDLVWTHEPAVFASIKREIEGVFGRIPVTVHAFGEAAIKSLYALFEQSEDYLLCTVTGEMTELSLISQGLLQGHATIPTGSHLPVRTLSTHAGLSMHEAHSALALARETNESMPLGSVITAAGGEFSGRFADAARNIAQDTLIGEVLVIGLEPQGEWFARALAGAPITRPFDTTSTVRALHTRHLIPYVTAHASSPDIILMLETVFIATLPRGVY